MDKILVQGRWHTQKSARIYLNEGLAVLATMKIPTSSPNIRPYYEVFLRTVQDPKFGTLEPPRSGRSGGRGKGAQRSRKRAQKIALFVDWGYVFFRLLFTTAFWTPRELGGLARLFLV